MQEYLTIKEASQLTGKSDATIRRLLRRKMDEGASEAMQMIRQTPSPSGFVYTMDRAFLENEGLLPRQAPTQGATQTQNLPRQNDESAYADDQAATEETPETEPVTGSHPLRQNQDVPKQESRGVGSDALVQALTGTIDVLRDQLSAKDDQLSRAAKQVERLIEDRERTDILLGNLQNRIGALEAPDDRRERTIKAWADTPPEPAGDRGVDPTSDAPEQQPQNTPVPASQAAEQAEEEPTEDLADSPQDDQKTEPGRGEDTPEPVAKRRGIWPFSRN